MLVVRGACSLARSLARVRNHGFSANPGPSDASDGKVLICCWLVGWLVGWMIVRSIHAKRRRADGWNLSPVLFLSHSPSPSHSSSACPVRSAQCPTTPVPASREPGPARRTVAREKKEAKKERKEESKSDRWLWGAGAEGRNVRETSGEAKEAED
ncbi:hypothetical protein IWX48DRAFT_306916 [Phyllosticta citricarpa]